MKRIFCILVNFIARHSDLYKETVDMFNRRLIERTQCMLAAIVKAEESERMIYRQYRAAMKELEAWENPVFKWPETLPFQELPRRLADIAAETGALSVDLASPADCRCPAANCYCTVKTG